MSGSRSAQVLQAAARTIALAACAGCFELTDPLPPSERRLLVHAVLEMGAPLHVVSVERTADGGSGSAEPVDAEVSLVLPNGNEVPYLRSNEPGLYYTAPAFPSAALVPGATHTLRIRTSQGEDVTGTTTIPASPAAEPDTVVFRPFDISRDTLRLSWPRVPGAKSYQVSILAKSRFAGPGVTRYHSKYSVFTDTTIMLPGNFRAIEEGNVFVPGDSLAIVVSAVDDNFYTYYHGSLDPFAGAPPSRLNGAVGVFGSIVPLVNRRYRVIVTQN